MSITIRGKSILGPNVVTDGLVLYLDAGNTKSYLAGTNWYDLINNTNFNSSDYTYPTFTNNYFTFINNGTTSNNIYGSPLSTSTQTQYTRIGWFYLTDYSGSWSPVIQNSIGNNSDMGLTILSDGTLHFRQYTNTYASGTVFGDYGVSSNGTFNLNKWHMAAIVVNRTSNQVTFYLDGAFDSTKSINVIGNSASDNVVVGGCTNDMYGGTRMLKGRISVVGHYNRLLTSTEILQNYNALKSRYGL